jgi:replication factor A1
MTEETAPLEEKIRRVLAANGFGKEEIDEAIRFFHDVVKHGTQPEVAMKNVYTKYGVSPVSPQKKMISEIRGDEKSIDLTAKIVRISKKDVAVNGQTKAVFTGILSDGSGSIRFTAWEEDGIPEGLKPGDIIRINKAYCKSWQGRPEIHLGRYSTITPGKEEDVAEGKKGEESLKIQDILSQRRTSTLIARVLEAERGDVEFTRGEGKMEKKDVISGVLVDTTGKLRFSYWNPSTTLERGDLVRISGGYLASWRGIPRLTLDEKDHIEKIEMDFPGLDALDQPRSTTLGVIFSEGGGLDVSIRGLIVELKENSGLIYRCTECRRVVNGPGGRCVTHPEGKVGSDLRVKGIIDDSTGSCIFVLGRALTEQILGMKIEECEKEVEKTRDPLSIFLKLERVMLGRPYEIRGEVLRDQFGYMLIARGITPIKIDAVSEARRLKDEWEREEG